MKVIIFTADSNGGYSVPAVKGGAVSTLIEHIVRENEFKQNIELTVVSLYDIEAEKKSFEYPHIHFIWIKTPQLIKKLDKVIYVFMRLLFKKKKLVSFISMASLLYYIKSSNHILKNHCYDRVILENNILMAWIIKLSKYKGNYTYHFHNIPRVSAGCKDVFENANSIFCVSNYVAKRIQSKDSPIGSINPTKTKILYNCVNTTLFRQIDDQNILEKERNKFGIKQDEKIIVFVGRLSEEKGIDKLLNAIPIIQTQNIKVLIVGSLIYNRDSIDSYQQQLHKLAEKLEGMVIFTGYIDQQELPLVYNIADVAVLPSIWDEPAGLTMIEAMACGTPVITTNAGGIPEYVLNCGIILERNEKLVQNIAFSIDNVLQSTAENAIVQKNKGIERVNTQFTAKSYLENFIELL